MPTVSGQALMQSIVLIAYPLICHFAMIENDTQLQLGALALMGLGLNFKGMLQLSFLSWGLMLLILILITGIYLLELTRMALYLPPILLPLLLWGVFYATLGAGQTPLITQIATSARGELSQTMQDYTRGITQLWTWVFALLALEATILPLVASTAVWSVFTNCLNWVVISTLFIGEFIYRQWRFKELEHPSFWRYLQIVIHADIRNPR
jgi:uncharacterized membrane protein